MADYAWMVRNAPHLGWDVGFSDPDKQTYESLLPNHKSEVKSHHQRHNIR